MLEKWGIYSFFFFGHMNSGSMYNFSFCFYSNDHLFWGALFPQTPSDSDQTRRIWLFVALQCLQPRTHSPHKTQHPQTTLPLWGKSDGHQEICQWKPASILPQIKFFILYFYKSPAHDSMPCPPSTPPAVLTPPVPLPQAQPAQLLSLLHFSLSPALNPYFLPLTQWLGAGGKAGDNINIYVRKSVLGNISWWSCHTQKKL